MNNYFSFLQLRPQFRSLWLAQVISLTGDWFNTIASVIIVNRYSASGLAVGGLFIARALPPFLLGPVAGVVADRFDRRKVLVLSDMLRAGIVLCFLLVDRPERLWLLYVLTVLQFSVSAFFEPARAALVPALVESDELLTANTLSSITWSAMLTLGGAIGGLTASLFGVRVSLMVDAASFLASAALVLSIPGQFHAEAVQVLETGWQNFVDGMNYVRKNLDVGLVTLVKAMGQVGSFDIIAALYAARVFREGQEGATTLGLMFTAFGVGAVVGPLISNRLGDSSTVWLQRAILGGFVCMPLAWLIVGTAPALPVALAGCVLRGAGGSINWTYSDVLLQMTVPNHLLGRVFAFDIAIFTLAVSISLWLTGFITDAFHLDPRTIVLLLATGSLAPLGVWGAALRWQGRRAETSG
ncbi:MAG TPA: MFS transporter [Anaerolineales bacterium]|nr:MFS transporter [Anaerolineales bacterium]